MEAWTEVCMGCEVYTRVCRVCMGNAWARPRGGLTEARGGVRGGVGGGVNGGCAYGLSATLFLSISSSVEFSVARSSRIALFAYVVRGETSAKGTPNY